MASKYGKMKTTIKNKWVKALESGKYKQTGGALRKLEFEGSVKKVDRYCCLGVLYNVCHARKAPLLHGGLSSVTKNKSGLSDKAQDHLISLNDGQRKTFKQIAAWIKRVL